MLPPPPPSSGSGSGSSAALPPATASAPVAPVAPIPPAAPPAASPSAPRQTLNPAQLAAAYAALPPLHQVNRTAPASVSLNHFVFYKY